MMKTKQFFMMFAVLLLLIGLSYAQLNVRNFSTKNDMSINGEQDEDIEWYQAEQVQYDIFVRRGRKRVNIPTNSVPVWRVWLASNVTNLYVLNTGTVVSASAGHVRFTLTPEQSNLPTNTIYLSAADVSIGTTNIGTIANSSAIVRYSPQSTNVAYVGTVAATSPFYVITGDTLEGIMNADGNVISNGVFYGNGVGLTNLAAGVLNDMSDVNSVDTPTVGHVLQFAAAGWTNAAAGAADNLGDHEATQAINAGGFAVTNTGNVEINGGDKLLVGSPLNVFPAFGLHVQGSTYTNMLNAADHIDDGIGGTVYAGLLLNGEDALVQLVSLDEGGHGSAILFQEIATNNDFNGQWVIGRVPSNQGSPEQRTLWFNYSTNENYGAVSANTSPLRLTTNKLTIIGGNSNQDSGMQLWGNLDGRGAVRGENLRASAESYTGDYTVNSVYDSNLDGYGIVEGREAQFQVAASEGGWGAVISLTEVQATTQVFSNDWTFIRESTAAGSDLHLKYNTTADPWTGMTVMEFNETGMIDFTSTNGLRMTTGPIRFFNSATPITDVNGEMILDTTITSHQPLFQYYALTKNMSIIAVDTSELPALDNEIIKYDAGTSSFVFEADTGGGGSPIDGRAATNTVDMGGFAVSNTPSIYITPQASPSTTDDGEFAVDIDAFGTNYDAIEFYNGTNATYVVATTAADTPSDGQVPTFNTAGSITWETPAGSGDMLQSEYDIDTDSVVDQSELGVVHVRNTSGGTLTKGAPVYVTGFTSTFVDVDLADSDDVAKMPAVGIIQADILNNANGYVVQSGSLDDMDTSAWTIGDALYVHTVAGSVTNVRPTAAGTAVQRIGTVVRSHASLGRLMVSGANRQNDVPNTISTVVTISSDCVNTANPWADNEVADDITASSYLPLAGGAMSGAIALDSTGGITDGANRILDYSGTAVGGNLVMLIGDVIPAGNGLAIQLDDSSDKITMSNLSTMNLEVGGTLFADSLTQRSDAAAADAGFIRMHNADSIAWEAAPAGTDITLTVDANGTLISSAASNAFVDISVDDLYINTGGSLNGADVMALAVSQVVANVISGTTGDDLTIDTITAGSNVVFDANVVMNSNLTVKGITYPTVDGTANQVIETDGSGTLSFVTPSAGGGFAFSDFATKTPIIVEEFLNKIGHSSIPTGPMGFITVGTAPTISAGTANAPGWLSLSGAASSVIIPEKTMIRFGTGTFTFQCRFTTPADDADVTDDYSLLIGYGDDTTGDVTDGCFLRYNKDSANFRYITEQGTTETDTDSSLAFTASTTYVLKIVCDTDSATFTINGGNSQDVSTNFPTGTQYTSLLIGQFRAAGATPVLLVDYVAFQGSGLTR